MLRYAITSGSHSGVSDETLASARRWSGEGVDYVQLREKHLEPGGLVRLAKAMLAVFEQDGGKTRLLVNHRADVAVATGCGVHLTSQPGELTAAQVRTLFADCRIGPPPHPPERHPPVIGISCHTIDDVRRAASAGVDLILFGPVFEKRVSGEVVAEGMGIDALQQASALAGQTPLLALGGVTASNAARCIEAGAAGVAGIRLFLSP